MHNSCSLTVIVGRDLNTDYGWGNAGHFYHYVVDLHESSHSHLKEVGLLCSVMYRVTHGTAPLYLVELCQPCSDTRLRSASRSDYNVHHTVLKLLTGVLLIVPFLSLPPLSRTVCLAISVAHLRFGLVVGGLA